MSSEKQIVSFGPSDGLSYNTAEATYWKEDALYKEIRRTFALCHSCRMCFKYCDTFPTMFNLLEQNNEDVNALSKKDIKQVANACFQCKLCEVECPYTPKIGHEFKLDFPKLMHRYQAINLKSRRKTIRELILTNLTSLGILARHSLGLANIMNRFPPHRWVLEKITGIHRKKLLPDFAPRTFETEAIRHNWVKSDQEVEVVVFQTCYVDNNEPEIGKDLVEVLERNQVRYTCLKGLKCCGMPAWEIGDLDTLRSNAHHNLQLMLPYVERGAKVMAINPTCSMMMRREYPELLEGEDRQKAEKLSAAITEPAHFIWSLRKEERFNTNFKSSPGQTIAYHVPCHLRALGIGFRSRELLKQIPGVTVKPVLECCGHNGTFAMKVESFEDSGRIGEKAFAGMKKAEGDTWATDCPLAAVQFKQFTGTKPIHPMSILARCYRGDSFGKK
jgi:Fe-S oxidoreductase